MQDYSGLNEPGIRFPMYRPVIENENWKYQCSQCGAQFDKLDDIIQHIKLFHPKKGCSQCGS